MNLNVVDVEAALTLRMYIAVGDFMHGFDSNLLLPPSGALV